MKIYCGRYDSSIASGPVQFFIFDCPKKYLPRTFVTEVVATGVHKKEWIALDSLILNAERPPHCHLDCFESYGPWYPHDGGHGIAVVRFL
jgi:hypothetical protein